MATRLVMPEPPGAASMPRVADRQAKPGLLPILVGFALLYTTHATTTSLTASLYGESGLLVCALALALALVVERLFFRRDPGVAVGALGLGRPCKRALGAAVLIAVLMMATGLWYALTTGRVLALRSDWAWLAVGLVAQYGVAEELIFRGYLFGHLRAGRTFRCALLISTLAFAAAHLPLLATTSLLVAMGAIALAVVSSLPFVWLYERGSRTIWAPVIVHAAAHAPKLLAPGTLNAAAELAWVLVVMAVPYLAFLLLRHFPRRGTSPTSAGERSVATNT